MQCLCVDGMIWCVEKLVDDEKGIYGCVVTGGVVCGGDTSVVCVTGDVRVIPSSFIGQLDMDGMLHVLMVPWLAFGHLLPFLELAKLLAGKGHRISYLTTPRNVARLISKIPEPLVPFINFIEFPLPRIKQLPENAEATIDLPAYELSPYLRRAFDGMEQKLSDLIQDHQTSKFHSIIYDYAAYWVPPLAKKFGVPCAFFSIYHASTCAFVGPPSSLLEGKGARTTAEEYTVVPAWIPFPSTIAFRSFEAQMFFKAAVVPDASGISEVHRVGKSIQGCQYMLIRSCKELDSEWLHLLGQFYEKPILPIGLLPPSSNQKEQVHALDLWLDNQKQGSVVYVSFGSEVKLTVVQVKEIAMGLELSELPFVWAVSWAGLPFTEGLVERTEGYGRGRIFMGWVPQVRILAHPSVGGFLSHCGLSSIVEGLALGRAMVVLPMLIDQGLNARYVVEKGFGIEVQRNEDGSFTGEEIAKSLRLALVEDEGEVFRAKARECRDLFGNEDLQDGYVKEIIEHITRSAV